MIKSNKKKIAVIAAVSTVCIGVTGVKATSDYIETKRIEKIELEKKRAEEERIANLKTQFPGVGIKGLDDAYDAKLVSEKLKTKSQQSI